MSIRSKVALAIVFAWAFIGHALTAGDGINNPATCQLSNCYIPAADPSGVTDSTAAIQAWLNSGVVAAFIPAGTYKACGLTVPNTDALHIYGTGTGTKLVQGNCGSPVFAWSTASNAYTEQTVSDLYIDSTAGTGHSINTTGAGGITISRIYFANTPAGFTNVFVNGANGVAVHDIRLNDIQVYDNGSSGNGFAFVEFGALVADSEIGRLIGNGNFKTNNGIVINSGVTGLRVHDNHPYNFSVNALNATGCSTCQFSGNAWDNANGDIVVLNGVAHSTFVGEQVEAINNGQNGITLRNSSTNAFIGTIFNTASTAANLAVNETGTSVNNSFIGGNIGTSAHYSGLFSFVGSGSYASNFPGYSTYGLNYALTGLTSSAQAQNTSQFLGQNGQGSSWPAPYAGTVYAAQISTDSTPASGQTFTFSAFVGASNIGSCVVTNGTFGCVMALNSSVSIGNALAIQSIFSATSGSAIVRYSLLFRG